jgi:hypothetical protein
MKLGLISKQSQALLDPLSQSQRDQAMSMVFGKVITTAKGIGTISLVGLFPVIGWLVGRSLGNAGWIIGPAVGIVVALPIVCSLMQKIVDGYLPQVIREIES